jgi:hypothetical protein
MKKTALWGTLTSLGIATISTTTIAQAQTAHQHGVASLNIAIAKQNLIIELQTPADNILGFEFMPKTDQQKQKLSDSLSLLKQADSLFEIAKLAGCSLKLVQIDNPFESEKAHDKEHKKHDEHDTHTNFKIHYSYSCQQADKLSKLNATGLFNHFPNFETLNVQWVNEQKQSATTLTKEDDSVNFNP